MADIIPKDLINSSRFPSEFWKNFCIIVYSPIGFVLAVLRLFIGLHAYLIACVLPKTSLIRRIVLRVLCGVLGIFVSKKGSENRKSDVKLLVSNHVSIFDHLAIDLILPNYMPFAIGELGLWGKLLGYIDFYSKKSDDSFSKLVNDHMKVSDCSLLIFPEGTKTNGKKGLLKYNTKTFSLELPVQPIALQVHRPQLTDISLTVVNGSWMSDAFWFLFVPYTNYDIRILPVAEPCEQNDVDFSSSVQKMTAESLSIVPSTITTGEIIQYHRKYRNDTATNRPTNHIQHQFRQQNNVYELPSTPSGPGTPSGHSTLITRNSLRSSWRSSSHEEDERITFLCQQVKEVLPHVPISAIRKDLAVTRDTDITISNILEGNVEFVPEDPTSTSTPTPTPKATPAPSQKSSSPPKPIAAKTFSRLSKERHLSLEERKKQLIDRARQRYIAKHGMSGFS